MVEIGPWLAAYRHAVLAEFGARVRFIGIQGSHARGEAGEGSDIDAVLILDRLTPHDLRRYRALAAGLPLSIDDAEAVQKSWPHFFEAIKPLGAEVEYAG